MNTVLTDSPSQALSPVQEVLDSLLSQPTPEEIIAFKSSLAVQSRLEELLERNREELLSEEEINELETYQQVNHFFILLKAHVRSA